MNNGKLVVFEIHFPGLVSFLFVTPNDAIVFSTIKPKNACTFLGFVLPILHGTWKMDKFSAL